MKYPVSRAVVAAAGGPAICVFMSIVSQEQGTLQHRLLGRDRNSGIKKRQYVLVKFWGARQISSHNPNSSDSLVLRSEETKWCYCSSWGIKQLECHQVIWVHNPGDAAESCLVLYSKSPSDGESTTLWSCVNDSLTLSQLPAAVGLVCLLSSEIYFSSG